MSGEALDLRRSAQMIWRHKALVGAYAALGLLGAVVFTVLYPPTYTSSTLVAFPPSVNISTQAVVVASDLVLSLARPSVDPGMSLATLHSRIDAEPAATQLMSITARGSTPAQAVETANAVTRSYVAYVNSPANPEGQGLAQVFQLATTAAGTSLTRRLYDAVAPCVPAGALIGAIIAIARGRNDRRLRDRDEIADSIGVPVLASVRVRHPSKVAGWTKLLGNYQPDAADAWQLHKVLCKLGAVGPEPGVFPGVGSSLAVLSLSSDRYALALGPQLAAVAASLGIPTSLVVGPDQDETTTAALRAACAAVATPSRGPRNLRVAATNHDDVGQLPPDALTVVVSVVDDRAPRVADTMRTTMTVLGVRSGSATAQQLARLTASAAGDGRNIAGILVADPDPADDTTGLLPQLTRIGQNRMPTRVTAQ
jgi:capsular polysaccharide biosynthesis protein